MNIPILKVIDYCMCKSLESQQFPNLDFNPNNQSLSRTWIFSKLELTQIAAGY